MQKHIEHSIIQERPLNDKGSNSNEEKQIISKIKLLIINRFAFKIIKLIFIESNKLPTKKVFSNITHCAT